MASILGAAVMGAVVLLFLGCLLALVAALLPRFLSLWEGGTLALEELGPAPLSQSEPGVPQVAPLTEKPVPPALSQSLVSQETAGSEESLVAAAIAVAVALWQGETVKGPQGPPSSPGTSSWALAGRWQAMQARVNLHKR